MGSSSNPLTGASWNSTPGNTGTPWLGNNPAMGSGIFGGGPFGDPGNYGNPGGSGQIALNNGLNNVIAGQMKNQLAPQFAQLMQQYGGQAGDFFKNLMNLGSPYYQQQQQAAFTQGVGQNQNAAAQAQQQLRSQGYGNTPSGANAAMIGGMQQAGAQSLAEQYLQNLFQNEAMQLQGGQGLASLAGLFNPAQLLGGTSLGQNVTQTANGWQNAMGMMNSVANLFGSATGGKGMAGIPGLNT